MDPVLEAMAEEMAIVMFGGPLDRASPDTRDRVREIARAARDAHLSAIEAKGLKIIGPEPTEEMIENDEISRLVIRKAQAIHSSELPCADIWRAMFDAAPPRPVEE